MRLSKIGAIPLVVVAVLTFGVCSSEPTPEVPPESTASAVAPTSQVVSAQEFANVIEEPDVVIVDVRTPQEFAEGHIEGALNIDVNGADFNAEVAKLDQTKRYAIYCRSGNRSATAVEYFKQQGFTGLYDLSGGIVSWQAADYPLV